VAEADCVHPVWPAPERQQPDGEFDPTACDRQEELAVRGVDDALIGLTILAMGTSATDPMTSAVAAFRNQADVAVGSVVGSNMFNKLWTAFGEGEPSNLIFGCLD
jgi:Ca2+/Na+ antiporter